MKREKGPWNGANEFYWHIVSLGILHLLHNLLMSRERWGGERSQTRFLANDKLALELVENRARENGMWLGWVVESTRREITSHISKDDALYLN